jgi:hypothetical protein
MDFVTKVGLAVFAIAVIGALVLDSRTPVVRVGSTPEPHPTQSVSRATVLPTPTDPAAALHTTPSAPSHTITTAAKPTH